MARFFIDRPVFAIVLAIIITLLGTIAAEGQRRRKYAEYVLCKYLQW